MWRHFSCCSPRRESRRWTPQPLCRTACWASFSSPPMRPSGGPDVDLLRRRALGNRSAQLEHAVLVVGLDGVRIDRVRETERPEDLAAAELGQMNGALVRLALMPGFGLDQQ